ncbi:MAG: hypothetical protein WAZ19_01235 [Anaerolineae bacterium]
MFFGIPYFFWGVMCVLMTLIWVFMWPKESAGTGGWRFIVLRWFHALTWALLAAAAFSATFNVLGDTALAQRLALLALAVYVVFIGTMISSSRHR